jgi:hypothetical protein
MSEQSKNARYHSSATEIAGYLALVEQLKRSPIPDHEILANLSLFLTRSSIGRLLFFHELYQRILKTPGIVMEFGVRWGANMSLFTSLRSLLEPYNLSRKIVGFDTFSGFPEVNPEDGQHELVGEGMLDVPQGYQERLEELLLAQEQLAPRPNIKKFELVCGDVVETLPEYLAQHPETILSLVYFDLDLYSPTKACLDAIRPHLVKNSVVAFDQLALAEFPGETIALREAWGLSDFSIYRSPLSPQQSYLVLD